jgi:CRISPR type IV-associated protein Csf3
MNQVNLGSGPFRNWMLRHVLVSAEWCKFYGYGNVERVRYLLSRITGLGNDNRMGWGRIHRLTVREIDEDRSLAWQGRAMRPIPCRFLRAWDDAVMLAWRPPYWAAQNIELCAPPGAQVELEEGASLAAGWNHEADMA